MKYNLSEINEVIRNRRTIFPKVYTDRKVHREMILNMLENAKWAPTHGVTQPWRFKVFTEGALDRLGDFLAVEYERITPVDQIVAAKTEKIRERASQASAVIAICMKRQESERIPEIEEVEAVACAVQNIWLTCTAYGLGGFWSTGGVAYSEGTKNFLELEGKDRCLGFFYVGYPAIEWPKGQRKPVEYFTEWIAE